MAIWCVPLQIVALSAPSAAWYAAFHSLIGLAATFTPIGSHLNEYTHFSTHPMTGVHMGSIYAVHLLVQ